MPAELDLFGYAPARRGDLTEYVVTLRGEEILRLHWYERAKALAHYLELESKSGVVAVSPLIGKPMGHLTLEDLLAMSFCEDVEFSKVGERFCADGDTVFWRGQRFLTVTGEDQARCVAEHLNVVDAEDPRGIIGMEVLPKEGFRLDRWFAADGTRLDDTQAPEQPHVTL